jgi:hypothetical protein
VNSIEVGGLDGEMHSFRTNSYVVSQNCDTYVTKLMRVLGKTKLKDVILIPKNESLRHEFLQEFLLTIEYA